jgi:hypothetical protein
VGYVKGNAIAGRTFTSMEDLRGHLRWWMREVADVRIHGTTGERPIDRFEAAEAAALRPLSGKPQFQQKRELRRTVHNDLCVEVDTNHYSVPWRFIGEEVLVLVSQDSVTITHAGETIASHHRLSGRKQRVVLQEHFHGLRLHKETLATASEESDELLRPLQEYESVAGGRW